MKSYEEIIKDLQRKIYYPVYFLSGEEPYYIDMISDFIEENLLQPEEKEFNLSILYGRDVDGQYIIDACKRFPMMSNYQLVIVKEAQDVKDIETLEKYIENPLSSTILVVCYKYHKLDKRKAFAKLIEKKSVLFESAKVYDNQVPAWIMTYVKSLGYSIQQKAAMMMAEYLGADLSKIVNEVSKIIISYPIGSEITPEQVELNIGISKDFNVFELQKALGTKNMYKANQIINYFAENEKENPIIKVIPILFLYFSKVFLFHHLKDKTPNNVASVLSVNRMFIDDYATAARNYNKQKLKEIFSLFRDYDLRSKGVGNVSTNSGELMKEMIYKILH
ncbi:MAG TPA: DNA polymerase III subunit delta [Bacteroidales bacterium]|nr:DNA polymerase III subunit delta [Bacteroidales bacterium]